MSAQFIKFEGDQTNWIQVERYLKDKSGVIKSAHQGTLVLDMRTITDLSCSVADEIVRVIYSWYNHKPNRIIIVTGSYYFRTLMGAAFSHRGHFDDLGVLDDMPTLESLRASAS
jgi:hypothetical protein